MRSRVREGDNGRAEALVSAAEAAHALVETSPRGAAAQAEELARDATAAGIPDARAAALHALGYAQYQLADPRALGTLRAAIRVAERASLSKRAAYARRLLAGIYTDRGKATLARREIDLACVGLGGADLARAQAVRLVVLANLGQEDVDLSFSGRALRELDREGDSMWKARLLQARGLVLWNRGRADAENDLRASRALWGSLGAQVAATVVDLLLVRLALSQDDIVEALARLESIDTENLPLRIRALADGDRGRVLLAARLYDEALPSLSNAAAILEQARTDASALEERLELARLLLIIGKRDEAMRIGVSIRRSAARRGNTLLAARAELLVLEAIAREGHAKPSNLRAASQVISTFDLLRRPGDRTRARIVRARLALHLDRHELAAKELASLSRARVAAVDRIDACAVDAMLRDRRGDRAGALRALRRGLRLLEEHRAGFGAIELRAAASGAGIELSTLGLRLALSSGKPWEVLTWAESLRSNNLRLPPVRPSRDAALKTLQLELRRVAERTAEVDRRGLATATLARRQAELENLIRNRARRARGSRRRLPVAPTARSLDGLQGRQLLEYVELDRRLFAITRTGREPVLHTLGDDGAEQLDWLRFALRRIARGGLDATSRAATLASANAAAADLDHKLVAPLLDHLDDSPLVVVPTGPLHALPWSALPSLRGRPVTVSPSLETWLDLTAQRRKRPGRPALIAGPRLRHAQAEVKELAAALPDATVLTGKAATVEAALQALNGATLAHIACHGHLRSDNPLFSALELADGPLTALDIQGLRQAPDVLVLSACDVALSEHHPGDELFGLSAALIGAGTRAIIASVVPVPDAAARRLMLAFHGQLRAGAPPATALATAQSGLSGANAALAGFVCLGAG